MKQILKGIAALAIVVGVCVAVAHGASGSYDIQDATSGGTNVVVPVDIASADTITSFQFTIDYPTTILDYASVSIAGLPSGFYVSNVNETLSECGPVGGHGRVLVQVVADWPFDANDKLTSGTVNVTFDRVSCGTATLTLPCCVSIVGQVTQNATSQGGPLACSAPYTNITLSGATVQMNGCGGGGGENEFDKGTPVEPVTWTKIKRLIAVGRIGVTTGTR